MGSHLLVVMVSSFPTIQDSCLLLLSSHVTSVAIAVPSCTLSSDRCPLSPLAFTSDSVTLSVGPLPQGTSEVRPAWSWTEGFGDTTPSGLSSGGQVPRPTPGPLPTLVRETLDTATSPSQLPA